MEARCKAGLPAYPVRIFLRLRLADVYVDGPELSVGEPAAYRMAVANAESRTRCTHLREKILGAAG